MRSELLQMERMAIDERFGMDAGDTVRRIEAIRRRMRHEENMRETEEYEALADLCGDCGA